MNSNHLITGGSNRSSYSPDALALTLIIGLTSIVYWQVLTHQFVAWDDTSYVSENQRVLQGITWDNVRWAFGTFQLSNWHPLALLSHMLDVEIWGLRPGLHAATNVAIHIVNSMLLYGLFSRALPFSQVSVPQRWSALVAALLFALHPMHVESVAWIAQRKDVLCAFFWLSAVAAYLHYANNRTALGYASTTVLVLLSLLSKPMAVSLPFVFLILDWWRLHQARGLTWENASSVVIEKLPWFGLSVTVALITIAAQESAMPHFDLLERIQLAIAAYGWYLKKTFWPTDLHFYYLTENAWRNQEFVVGLSILFSLTWLALCWRNSRPGFLVGWIWFLVTLVPVVGFVKVGTQAWADRYVYLPHVGLLVMCASGSGLINFNSRTRGIAGVSIVSALLLLTWITWRQVATWKDTPTLYRNALSIDQGHYVAMMGLANHYYRLGDFRNARAYATKALSLSRGPSLARSMHNVLGEVALASSNLPDAINHFELGKELDPSSGEMQLKLGFAYMKAGQLDRAEASYRDAMAKADSSVDALNGLGVVLGLQMRFGEALRFIEQAAALAPNRRDVLSNLATLASQSGNPSKAQDAYVKLLALDPMNEKARAALADMARNQE